MKGNMSPSRGSGIKRGLTFEPETADKSGMGSSWARESAQAGAGRSSDRERGQALVEFALILPLFLIILVGLVQFGVGLNYWLDLNRLANQAARWAVVNCNPTSAKVCEAADGTKNIELAIRDQRTSDGNDIRHIRVCYETSKTVGQPLTVSLKGPFGFKQLLDHEGLWLRAKATMRIEQNLTHESLGPLFVNQCSAPDPFP